MSDDHDKRRFSECLMKIHERINLRVRDTIIEEAERADRELASLPVSPTSPLSDARNRMDVAYDTSIGASLTAVMASFGITDGQYAARGAPQRYHNAVELAAKHYADTFRETLMSILKERGAQVVEIGGAEGDEISIETLQKSLSNLPKGMAFSCNWDRECSCPAIRLRRRDQRWIPICDCCSREAVAREERKASFN